MKYKSFQEYLLVNNLTDKLSETDRIELQAQWRKAYQRAYHKNYGQKRIRKTITLSPVEDAQLQKAAEAYDLKMNDFLKETLFAYLNNVYVVPNQNQVQQLILQIRKIGTNINQIARHINSCQKVEEGQLGLIYVLLKRMELCINNRLCQPELLEERLEEVLQKQPEYGEVLQHILTKHKTKNKNV